MLALGIRPIKAESRESVYADIGIFLQAIAALELCLDDLLGLANDRITPISKVAAKYPVNLRDKLQCVPKIAQAIGAEWDSDTIPSSLDAAIDVRHSLSHGRIVAVRSIRDGYELTVSKMGRPEKIDGRQKLVRANAKHSRADLLAALDEVDRFQRVLEALHRELFAAGEGWPATYLVAPEGDPLLLLRPSKAMRRHD